MSSRFIKLSGPELELAKCISEEWKSMHADVDFITAKAEREIASRRAVGQQIIKDLMGKVMDRLGVPQGEVRSLYGIDARYLDQFGDAYVVPPDQQVAATPIGPQSSNTVN